MDSDYLIFKPCKRVYIFVTIIELLLNLPIIYLLILQHIRNAQYFTLLSFLVVMGIQIILFFMLYLEFFARKIILTNSYVEEVSYLIKRKRLYISEITACKITHDRNPGESYDNLKIIGKGNNILNINMFCYSKNDLSLLREKIGFPIPRKSKDNK